MEKTIKHEIKLQKSVIIILAILAVGTSRAGASGANFNRKIRGPPNTHHCDFKMSGAGRAD